MKWNLFQSRRTKKLRPTHVNAKPCRLAVEALEDRWLPSTITWLNNASGFFNVPTNWQGGVPTPSDDAIIPFSGITVTSSANVTVNSITCTGATLAIAANASFTAVGGGLGGTTSSISTLTLGSGSTLQASASTLAIGGGTSAGTLTALTGAIIAFNFNSGQFTMNSGSSLSGSGLFFVGGFETVTLNVDENAPTNLQLDNNGTVNGTGNLTITNTFTWTGGTLGGSSTTIVPAGTTLNISNNFNKFVTGSHVLNLAGTTTWTGTGELDGSPGSTINNSGTFTAQNDGVCGNGGQGAGVIFNNNTNGVFTKSGTTGTTSFAGNLLNNSGTVNINSGTLTLSGGGTGTGTFNTAAGATVVFDSANTGPGYILNSGTTLNGAGLYRVVNTFDLLTINTNLTVGNFEEDNGTVTAASATLTITTAFTWTGGGMTGAGVTTVSANGTTTISGATNKYLTVSHVLNLAGTTTWTGAGELDGSPGATINNSGTFTAGSDAVCGNGGAGAGVIFNNSGTFTKSGTTGTTAFQGNLLNNSGTVNVQSGTLTFTNDYIQTAGTTVVSTGATLATSGAVKIQGGSLNGLGTVNADVQNAGTVGTGSAIGTLTISRTFTQTSTGTLAVKVAGPTQFDTIAVGGTATMAGTFNVNVINNFAPNQGSTFKVVTFASGSGTFATMTGLTINTTLNFNSLADPTDMTLVVVPTHPGVLQFSAGTYTANVTSATATITVTRGNGSGGTVSVNYATSDGSAIAGVSYTATTGTLTFAQSVTSQTFAIPILSGAAGLGNQTINLTISTPTGTATLGTQTTAVLTLLDTTQNIQAGQLQFATSAFMAPVSVSSATIKVTRTNGSGGTVTVQYATSDGTAQAGTRYTATAGTLSFVNGVTSQSFTIPILNPSTVHGNQTVNLTLSNVTGGGTLGPAASASAVLTIVDNNLSDTVSFVSGLYHNLLARAADSGGLAAFQATVDTGRNQVLIQFAAAYVVSAENRSNFVTGAYTKYLGRTPSAAEVTVWVTALQQGTTAEQVIAAFVGSAEYFQIQGSSNSSWVNHAYQDILGRQADSGSQGFLTQLNGGVSLTVIATALVGSTEYRSNLISQVYATYLFRQAGPSDLQTWLPVVGQMSAGPGKPSPDEQFLTAVIGSVEYFQKIGNSQLAWTTSLYTKVLGRTPGQSELTNLLVGVLNGFTAPRQAAAAGVAASTEAETAAVAGYYSQFLGRTGSASEVSGWVNLITGGGSREQVIAAIAGSTEYFQKHGGANNTFVDQLYLDLLGRTRGSSETGFLTALSGGTLTPQQAAAAILQSTEYAQRLVNQFYSAALGRLGSLTEINGWVQLLQQGVHDEQILAQIITSAEFFLGSHPYP